MAETQTAPAPDPKPEKPEWMKDYPGLASIPEKFIRPTLAETIEAQTKGYAELEKLKSKPSTPATPPAEEKSKPEAELPASVTPESTGLELTATETDDDEDGINKLIAAAGFAGKEKDLYEQWEKEGNLTAEQYAAFKKAGRTKSEVDAIAAGMHAAAQIKRSEYATIRNAALDIVGGESAFKLISSEAAIHMDGAEVERLNQMLKTKDAPIAAARLKLWYDQHTGTAGSGQLEPGNGATKFQPPKTLAEARAMQDKAVRAGDTATLKMLSQIDPRSYTR